MTSFTQSSYPAQRLDTARMDATQRGFNSTKGLSALLLAAMVSALVVVADQLMDTWVNGNLMFAWIGLWLVGFAALAIFAGAAHKLARTVVGVLDAWSVRVAKTRAEQRLWLIAKSDPRVMADLTAAMARGER